MPDDPPLLTEIEQAVRDAAEVIDRALPQRGRTPEDRQDRTALRAAGFTAALREIRARGCTPDGPYARGR